MSSLMFEKAVYVSRVGLVLSAGLGSVSVEELRASDRLVMRAFIFWNRLESTVSMRSTKMGHVLIGVGLRRPPFIRPCVHCTSLVINRGPIAVWRQPRRNSAEKRRA